MSVSAIQHRDFRSEAKSFKRDRDSGEKWSMGTRPLAGVRVQYDAIPGQEEGEVIGDNPNLKEKVRPCKPSTNPVHKSHAKNTTHYDTSISNPASNRTVRKVNAIVDASDHSGSPLSRSLLELLPQHANNTTSAIQTAIRDHDSSVLYSYDNIGASPTAKGRAVGLDSLVAMAEKKWAAEQTDKIVKGEYEVLDAEGETTVLRGKNKKKGSPSQKAVKTIPPVVKNDIEEDDGFELV